jgi:hypothetical protein
VRIAKGIVFYLARKEQITTTTGYTDKETAAMRNTFVQPSLKLQNALSSGASVCAKLCGSFCFVNLLLALAYIGFTSGWCW